MADEGLKLGMDEYRIKGDKYRFELQFLKWDFSWDAVAAQGYILRWRGNHVVFLEV